ncbi:type II toxin-antitoxin system YafO family toxin [Massilia sp. W12]|uniref:type II toxin-antitoxin system YafO family toxin n=1 Tax=Massilia sp. W12 TaxID=3126507 RepID=UPI0030CBE533
MTVRIFTHKHFKANCPDEMIAEIINDFRKYKNGDGQPERFGRDVPFDESKYTSDAGLMHIHVKDASSKNWHLKKITYHKTSNTALIYCEASRNPGYFLLIGFVQEAHQYYRKERQALLAMADIAEDFRKVY